jgi:nitrogen fixation protein NifZ
MKRKTDMAAEPREPRYQWGQPVTTVADIVNDGSYPDAPLDAVLAAQNDRGEIVNVGMVEETGEPVYLVEFPDGKVIGVFEEEIAAA